ncbi:MAG: TonB family protein [Candidatus Korobacteraceae bacterium]|jgi:TonB family protein
MSIRLASMLLLLGLATCCMGQAQSDCPPRVVIDNGVCVLEGGKPCPHTQLQSPLCNDIEPAYTVEAAKAHVKGTVLLSALIGKDGCAHDISVVRPLGYGLDEAAVFAMERMRFRRPTDPHRIDMEINFNPDYGGIKAPPTNPTCTAFRSAEIPAASHY